MVGKVTGREAKAKPEPEQEVRSMLIINSGNLHAAFRHWVGFLSLSLSLSLLMSVELTGLGRYGLVLQSHFTGTDRATAHTSARKPLNNFLLIYCAVTYSNWEVVNNTN